MNDMVRLEIRAVRGFKRRWSSHRPQMPSATRLTYSTTASFRSYLAALTSRHPGFSFPLDVASFFNSARVFFFSWRCQRLISGLTHAGVVHHVCAPAIVIQALRMVDNDDQAALRTRPAHAAGIADFKRLS